MNERNAGRKVGYRKPIRTYRFQYAHVIELLKEGIPIRKIAYACACSTNTVLKVKKIF